MRVSRIALVVGVVAVGFRPLCFCPSHYMIIAIAGVIAALFGPRLYHWAGAAFVITMLLFAVQERRAKGAWEQDIAEVRAQVDAEIERRQKSP